MEKELKIWLDDEASTCNSLERLGASFQGENTAVHTYFMQPAGRVLKLIESQGKHFLHKLKEQDGQFVFIDKRELSDPKQTLSKLRDEFGVKRQLTMHIKHYQLNGYEVGLYRIEGIGKFLILSGKQPTITLLKEWFNLQNPRVVSVPFDIL